jgi:hypothetical protein
VGYSLESYREIYDDLIEGSGELGWPSLTPEILRLHGLDVRNGDSVKVSIVALLILLLKRSEETLTADLV